ncbi:bifunctional 2-polyprenyl-6-hydroxyphenol methylase/3-demethylubiquinol 3-O-methyltransferase UbiG [Thalassospira sp. TSL5-1]|uniref:class I SAM-dependent methyltransferase n=1 Tax=Thalassospira sp. TSL5-1 TaxID=1544451 RepID=UPI001C070C59|nr:class I SAM-dependent methyltransferase [Thalassospira sp. TSL5-1]
MPEIQNIYDDPTFHEGYRSLRQTGTGLNDVLEQPALRSLLPPHLAGLEILDLGCGFGDFARYARQQQAASVTAIDVSRKMLDAARQMTNDPAILFAQGAIENLAAIESANRPFDLIISSLALHYVADYPAALVDISNRLKPGGRLVFSVEHPICTALAEQQWHLDEAGDKQFWPVDNYRDEGPRQTHWFVDDVIKYHRTVETYVNGLLDAGLQIIRLLEPEPVKEATDAKWHKHRRRPPFLILAAQKL